MSNLSAYFLVEKDEKLKDSCDRIVAAGQVVFSCVERDKGHEVTEA